MERTLNFDNVTTGQFNSFFANGNPLGYNDNASIKITPSKEEIKSEQPEILVKTIVNKIEASIEANLKEVKMENILLSMGLQDNILTNIEGDLITTFWKTLATWASEHAYSSGAYAEATVLTGLYYEATTGGTSGTTEPTWPTTAGQTVVDGTVTWTARAYPGEAKTMAPWKEGSTDFINLAGYNIVSTTNNKPVIYNSTYTEKYVENTDYWVNYKAGRVVRNPDGDITATQALKVLYKYTEIDQQKIAKNPKLFKIAKQTIKGIHRMATTGRELEFKFFNTQSDGNTSIQMGEKSASMKLKLEANSDENRTNYSIGRIAFLAVS